ncbi:hypothetical protein ACGYJ8_20295 [Sulfitobacter sp. 1A12126]|jgi:hypothetical protein|uniref:hypothetical protein n=1 Tax=Sulfitobacter sp. 1A12126 TaxID=3368591 RepID=UPI00374737AE
MSKEVPLTQARDVIPLTLKPSSFPQHAVEKWRLLVDAYLESPSEAEEGDLLGLDIGHVLVGASGYPASEVQAFFFLEGGVCDARVMNFPTRSAGNCVQIERAFEHSIDIGLISKLFGHWDWSSRQLHTLVFRDFTLIYDGLTMQGARDVSSKMRLILHDKTSGSTPAQLKQNIELGLNGFAGARDGLSRVRFIVDLEA